MIKKRRGVLSVRINPAPGGFWPSAESPGLPLKVIQERLGHSSIALTANSDSQLFPSGDDHPELAAAEAALVARRDKIAA